MKNGGLAVFAVLLLSSLMGSGLLPDSNAKRDWVNKHDSAQFTAIKSVSGPFFYMGKAISKDGVKCKTINVAGQGFSKCMNHMNDHCPQLYVPQEKYDYPCRKKCSLDTKKE